MCCLVGVPQEGGRILKSASFLECGSFLEWASYPFFQFRKVEFELDNRSISFLYFFLCLLIDLEIAR